ncbi:MAG: helix-turn-helix transcriptional regulator [Syntrophobacteraceae bacterium]
MDLIRVKDISRHLPVKPATLYKYARTGVYPQIFKRFGGKLLVDLTEIKLILNGQDVVHDDHSGAKNGKA